MRGARLGEAGIDARLIGDVDVAEQPADLAATASPAAAFMSKIATLTPLAAKARAVASPRPDAPPVTIAGVVESTIMSGGPVVV